MSSTIYQYTIFNIKKEKKTLCIILNLQLWDFSKGPKNELDTTVVNKPCLFEPLKVYCSMCSAHISKCSETTRPLNKFAIYRNVP